MRRTILAIAFAASPAFAGDEIKAVGELQMSLLKTAKCESYLAAANNPSATGSDALLSILDLFVAGYAVASEMTQQGAVSDVARKCVANKGMTLQEAMATW